MELVSVIITTCKREPDILKRALESVVAQSYHNIEIIVVDDSPADYIYRNEVQMLVQSYGNIRYYQHEIQQGACVARNAGLSYSHGAYVAFLDDDDEWYPQKIERQLTGFNNENIALVYCGNDVINDDTGNFKHDKRRFISGKIFRDLLEDNFIGSTSYPLIRRDILIEIGGFDPLMKSSQDYDVWLRIAEKYEINYVAESLVLYHVHSGEQITKNPQKKIQGLERIYKKHEACIKRYPEAKWNRIIKIAPFYAMAGNKKKAFLLWINAVRTKPLKIKKNLRYLFEILRV